MFINKELDKSSINKMLHEIMVKYDHFSSLKIIDKLKTVGFKFATASGFSLSFLDFEFPKENLLLDVFYEDNLLLKDSNIVKKKDSNLLTWIDTNQKLKSQLVYFFKQYNPFNKIFLMSNSGVRGSIIQVSQMLGFRGIMSDPSGDPVKYPIKHSFREGLDLLEFLIAAFGSRKGIVDTALGTAESGYLTRRLVELAYNVLIRRKNCKGSFGFFKTNLFIGKKDTLKDVTYDEQFCFKTPLLCKSSILTSICQNCFGKDPSTKKIITLGYPVGIVSAQSISEPSTQMTMRTFHTGGVFGSTSQKDYIFLSGFCKTFKTGRFIFDWQNNSKQEFFNSYDTPTTVLNWTTGLLYLSKKEKKVHNIAPTKFETTYVKKNVILKKKVSLKPSSFYYVILEGSFYFSDFTINKSEVINKCVFSPDHFVFNFCRLI